jgi:Protein of unknown function (DUF1573)
MKKLFLVLLCPAVIAACNHIDKHLGISNSQTASTDSKKDALADTANYTSIEWLDSINQNLGKINEGQQLEVTYRFRNSGDKPLVITNARASCGCTVIDPPKEPITPGEVGKIRAKFDSKDRQGEQHKDIYVSANTKPSNNMVLSFRVEVIKK